MNQLELIHNYNKENKIPFNPELFDRSNEDIIRELQNIILSCRRNSKYFSIGVNHFEVIEDYEEIRNRLRIYQNTTNKNKKRINSYDYINLKDSDIILLKVNYQITVSDDSDTLDVYIMVPRLIDKYHFRINGIMYLGLYQIVDGSTYNNNNTSSKNAAITMKAIFMLTKAYILNLQIQTTKEETLNVVHTMSFLFSKSVPAHKYILAKYGFYGAMEFLGLSNIFITNNDIDNNNFYTFRKGNVYISVPKELYDKDHMTQSFVYTIFKSIVNDNIELLFTRDFWIRSLGVDFNNYDDEKFNRLLEGDEQIPDTIDKGYGILDSFESIYDISTRETFRLPEEYKKDMYCILRWMLREFNYLKMKDNLDLSIKKARFASYISTLYAMKLVYGIYRMADMNKRVTVSSIKRAINTAPNYLLKILIKNKLTNYRNMVNDLDSISALKFTYKGISGLGESSKNSIPDIFRAVHPSHLGRLDLDSSSNTDPGVTGTIVPFCKLYNGYFSDYSEPNFWEKEFGEILESYFKARKFIEPLEFQEQMLGKDMSVEKETLNELVSYMEQVIIPIMETDDREGFGKYPVLVFEDM